VEFEDRQSCQSRTRSRDRKVRFRISAQGIHCWRMGQRGLKSPYPVIVDREFCEREVRDRAYKLSKFRKISSWELIRNAFAVRAYRSHSPRPANEVGT
jgi:hypothetical protein